MTHPDGRNASLRYRMLSSTRRLRALARSLMLLAAVGCLSPEGTAAATAEVSFLELDKNITVRRMIVRNPTPKGVVLFLHGFPETLHVWKSIALTLGEDYEVHAFDWPGYGISSRPPADVFTYAPQAYAKVLEQYIVKAAIDRSRLVIYATDIGALPVLLLALVDPHVAKAIVVGDFAPFDRPQHMYPSLQSLKSKSSSETVRAHMNSTKNEILEHAFRRGLSKEEQFEVSPELRDDMSTGWDYGSMTSADAFYHYYSHFTRDQDYLELNLKKLRTPVKVVWGERDIYIKPEMGVEFAKRIGTELRILRGVGHYPHLQVPSRTVDEVRARFDR